MKECFNPKPIIFEDTFFGYGPIGEVTYAKNDNHCFIMKLNKVDQVTKENIKIKVEETSFANALYRLFELLYEKMPILLNDSDTYNTICKKVVKAYMDVILDESPSERYKSQILFEFVLGNCNVIIFKEPIDELGHISLTINSETNCCRIRNNDNSFTISIKELTNNDLNYLINNRVDSIWGNFLIQTNNGDRLIVNSFRRLAHNKVIGRVWALLELTDKDYGKYNVIDNNKTTYKPTPQYFTISNVMEQKELINYLPKNKNFSFGRLVLHLDKNNI